MDRQQKPARQQDTMAASRPPKFSTVDFWLGESGVLGGDRLEDVRRGAPLAPLAEAERRHTGTQAQAQAPGESINEGVEVKAAERPVAVSWERNTHTQARLLLREETTNGWDALGRKRCWGGREKERMGE